MNSCSYSRNNKSNNHYEAARLKHDEGLEIRLIEVESLLFKYDKDFFDYQ